jgi:hypothetical protein
VRFVFHCNMLIVAELLRPHRLAKTDTRGNLPLRQFLSSCHIQDDYLTHSIMHGRRSSCSIIAEDTHQRSAINLAVLTRLLGRVGYTVRKSRYLTVVLHRSRAVGLH